MEQIEEAQRLNVPLDIAHAVCPGEGTPPRVYAFSLTVTRRYDGVDASEEKLAEVAGATSSASFLGALGELTELLQKRWDEVQKWAPIADADPIQTPIEGDTENAQGSE